MFLFHPSFAFSSLFITLIRLSISCFNLPSLVNKTLRDLNSSTWGRNSLPTRSWQSTLFWPRTVASDLEVMTLIPGSLHFASNHPCKRWRSQPDEAIRTKSSAKKHRCHLWISQTRSVTRDNPGGVHHSLGTSLTYCCGHEPDRDRIARISESGTLYYSACIHTHLKHSRGTRS